MKLDNVSSCVIPQLSRDDVELLFQEADVREDDIITQMTIHFPPVIINEDDDDEEADQAAAPAEVFQKQILDAGLITTVTGNVIVEFTKDQGNFVTPRGKYSLQVRLLTSQLITTHSLTH